MEQNVIEELKESTKKLGEWLRKHALKKSGTTEFREAMVLHRQAIDWLARKSITAS